MFSFRRRPKDTSTTSAPPLRSSPSLPELHAQGIPWPENLVDVTVLRETPVPNAKRDEEGEEEMELSMSLLHYRQQQGAVKSSLHSLDRAPPILFHKPFWLQPGHNQHSHQLYHPAAVHNGVVSISSLYMSPQSAYPAFDHWRSGTPASTNAPTVVARRVHRKNRNPPAFNLMVVGGRGTGKTSLLRLLLDTSDISSAASEEQRASLHRFLRGELKQTQSINTACIETSESRYERVLLTVIDTPGLDFSEGKELGVERQVTSIIKYIDQQYADTMIEESKVVRQSRGDQHIHLCIFMIDPSSIMTSDAHRAKSSSLPRKAYSETRLSSSTVRPLEPDDRLLDSSTPGELTMSPAELQVIRRLSERVNVLPIIARADSLTDSALSAVKDAVRRGLHEVQLDFGIFSTPMTAKDGDSSPSRQIPAAANENDPAGNGSTPSDQHLNGDSHATPDTEAMEPKDGHRRASRPVIRVKTRQVSSRSRSRSRRDLSALAQDEREPHFPEEVDELSVANVRFSAQTLAKTDLGTLLPFAFIAPEPLESPRTIQLHPLMVTPDSSVPREDLNSSSTPVTEVSMTGGPPDSPATITRKSVYNQTPPEDLRGVFKRKFRWGTVDVLNPDHCDFAALRTAMLLTHMKVLKVHTREVLYERYRTEKLLAKRATRAIGPEQAKRLLEDLGL
ncbi:Septin-domain-containing protein [Pisolithus orientalis]|uniref:Septin-domain-containing protein n=1 Tax=Pisolithus orientalis TaxID=936130 RepID=UPI0022240218|nr:Septin-domain-containing protein [Pisolithus orientalis]KAI6030866.1 Septin-domain-containing protein [Pisolithus orientalis]